MIKYLQRVSYSDAPRSVCTLMTLRDYGWKFRILQHLELTVLKSENSVLSPMAYGVLMDTDF
jgi:hypothetical protein